VGGLPTCTHATPLRVRTRAGRAPLAVNFTDLSTGSSASWNWSFGDGTFSEEQHPTHSYVLASNYTVSLVASNAFVSDNRTVAEYIKVEPSTPAFDGTVEFSSVTPVMLQGEHYLVDIKVNNTGIRNWSGNPASPDYVYLQGIGGSSGDAAKFNLTHIPMLFENETVAQGESYDFFFFMEAPDVTGNYSPAYQVTSEGAGPFGEISYNSVSVIENPFHPVTQPDGTKLYTTSFGNTSAGFRVDIVGPKVYLDDLVMSDFQDPQYLINPALKSKMIDIKLNESFTYADITFDYNPAKVPNPANLSLGYYNTTTGNYSFVPTTVDTANHKITSRVTHFSDYGTYDEDVYHALPVEAQNNMGWKPLGPLENWTVAITSSNNINTVNWFNGGMQYPPGNYTIKASGQYHDQWTIHFLDWRVSPGVKSADDDYGANSWGMYVHYTGDNGQTSSRVSSVKVSSGVLEINHKGGPIGIRNYAPGSYTTGADVRYNIQYKNGPLTRAPSPDYLIQLVNFVVDPQVKFAIEYYSSSMGCILGRAGAKGNLVENFLDERLMIIPGSYDMFLGEKITTSAAYQVGHAVCMIAAPELLATRDILSDYYVGDTWGMMLDSTGYLTVFQGILRDAEYLPQIYAKMGGNPDAYREVIKALRDANLLKNIEQNTGLEILKKGRNIREIQMLDELTSRGNDVQSIAYKIVSRGGLAKAYVWEEAGVFNKLPGIKRYVDPTRDRTVLGTFTSYGGSESYSIIGFRYNANYLEFASTPDWTTNQKFLDMIVENGDEIILSVRPSEVTNPTSRFLQEYEYLKTLGYEVSTNPSTDGLYRLIRTS